MTHDTRITLESIEMWHHAAKPQPTPRDLTVSLGVLLEEVAETLRALRVNRPVQHHDVIHAINAYADDLKAGCVEVLEVKDRQELLDGLADTIVTAVGVGQACAMNVALAAHRVNESNWSKFVDGKPLFNASGKIAKGPGYQPPDLRGCF